MTLPAQLRAIADRLEAAEADRAAALDELWQIRTVDSAAAPPSAPIDAGVVQVAPTPARHAGDAGSTPATRSKPSARSLLPEKDRGALRPAGRAMDTVPCSKCGERFKPAGLLIHQARKHGVRSAATRLADRKKVPTNGRGYSSPIGVAALPPTPVIRHGKETYLCSRCTEHFATAEALKGHMMKGHPSVSAAPTRPFGEQPVLERSGGGLP